MSSPAPDRRDDLVTLPVAAAMLGVSVNGLRTQRWRDVHADRDLLGAIPEVRLSPRRLRYRRRDVEAFVQAKTSR